MEVGMVDETDAPTTKAWYGCPEMGLRYQFEGDRSYTLRIVQWNNRQRGDCQS